MKRHNTEAVLLISGIFGIIAFAIGVPFGWSLGIALMIAAFGRLTIIGKGL